MTVRLVLCFTLPAVASTVTVYVPAGVPGVVCGGDEPPPQPPIETSARTINGAARRGCRGQVLAKINPEANKNITHTKGRPPDGKPGHAIVPVVTGAVVAIVTVSGAGVPAVTLTEPGKVQVGADVAAGLMLQARFTVPLHV